MIDSLTYAVTFEFLAHKNLFVKSLKGYPPYKKDGSTTTYTLDEELIRSSSDTIRCDILGLTKGSYSVTIKNTTADVEVTKTISVTEHDRSGYAHFDNNGGVGAYNDDGSLKSNAIVIYVNDLNIIYEDDSLIVVDKPHGILTIGTAQEKEKTPR